MKSNKQTSHAKIIAAVLAAASCFTTGCGSSANDGIDQAAVERANAFLSSPEVGKDIISYMHMGMDYRGHEYLKTVPVKTADGTLDFGHFALIYRFEWGTDGYTNVAFYFDPAGCLTGLKVLKSNGLINRPFFIANFSVQVLGNMLIESFREKMDPNQLQQAQKFIDDADVKGLLEIDLSLRQTQRT